ESGGRHRWSTLRTSIRRTSSRVTDEVRSSRSDCRILVSVRHGATSLFSRSVPSAVHVRFNRAMSPRDEILAELSRRPIPPVELPSLDGEWQSFDDLMSRFCEVLRSVGGDAITVSEVSAIDRELEKLPTYASADRIVSLVPGVAAGSVDLQTIERPHDL